MTHVITEPCVGICNTACVEVCPVDCIFPAKRFLLTEEDIPRMICADEMLYIDPEQCIDCGACEPECPVEAIFPEHEVPEKYEAYIGRNYQRFGLAMNLEADGGNPG